MGQSDSRWRGLFSLAWPDHPTRWRDVPGRVQPALRMVIRLTAAAVVAYLFTLLLTDGAVDLTGPLTALLVVQASAFSTLKMGVVRVGAVLSGVLVATLLSTWIGLTWWSLGAAIAASLVLAKVLRLGEQAIEVPISAMLILGVTNHDIAAEIRVLNTLIGAGVGVAFNLIYPPAMPTGAAGRAVLRVAEAAASALDAAGDALVAGPVNRKQVESWLDRVRSGARRVADAAERISLLKDSRRFNPRALGTTDVEPVLATGLDTLESCLLAIRALFVVLRAEIPPEAEPDDPYGEELREAFAVVLHDAADCLRAFGSLVVAEAEGREEETEQALADSLEILRETQAILTELIMVNAADNTSSWLLRGSILAAVEQVLVQLNLEDRARVHRAWKDEQMRRPMAQLPPLIQGVLPHPELPYPRGLQPALQRLRPPRLDSAEDTAEPQDAPAVER
ncbi:MAG: FUSC family protein [Propionibacteriaceae bacterium]|nr:FUSC family protein [Propionibacteriaceae bacterium]